MQTRSALVRIVALVVLLYSLGLFASSVRKVSMAEAVVAAMTEELDALHGDVRELEDKLAAVESGEAIEALARERLGLVMPGERIFYFTFDGAAPGALPEADGGLN